MTSKRERMPRTADLVAFLRERFEEDQQWADRVVAKSVERGWTSEDDAWDDMGFAGLHEHAWATQGKRTLAEVDAKRRIIDDTPTFESEFGDWTDDQLHERCIHPAWEYETTEGQRKAWYDGDVPPEGEGWERNVNRGRDGWERFEFTEESYWRRLRPGGPRPMSIPRVLKLLALPYADHPSYRPEWRP